jgi:hypothetical protein
MNSKMDIDSLDMNSHQKANDSTPAAGLIDDQIRLKNQKFIEKLNHFMVDQRYALKLDEVM